MVHLCCSVCVFVFYDLQYFFSDVMCSILTGMIQQMPPTPFDVKVIEFCRSLLLYISALFDILCICRW